jgi:vacuolar-type H+-ATPase subunit E/Vma4
LREEFRNEALRREERYMRQLHEIKDDVRWLVRKEADKAEQ